MIACFKGIANLLAANSAIEKTEFRFDIVELFAFSAVKLRYISWNVLFAFAMHTDHCYWRNERSVLPDFHEVRLHGDD